MRTPELLAPAGTLKHLETAFAYGADAVYAGLPRYSLRVRNNDFDLEQLATGIARAHALGKRLYLAANVLPHNAKVRTFVRDLEPAVALAPDGLIVADPGVLLLARERWPDLPLHLSVQANTVNFEAVRFWARNGVARIILSRELGLEEIAEIRQLCPDTELEVFVHGALCIAYSGRCLLSGYFNHRDANQGACTNACRWEYQLHPAVADGGGDLHRAGGEFLLEQRERPGDLMPVEEDEHGTYILNSKDLRAVQHVARLAQIGIDSLKIEGRTKTVYYVARTTQVYRRAIDDAGAGRDFDPRLLADLENLANRGYTEGFYDRHADAMQNYATHHSDSEWQQYVGEITAYDAARGLADVDVKNRFAVGDRLELISPAGNRSFVLDGMWARDDRPVDVAPGGGWQVRVPLPAGDHRHAFLARHLTER